jgi:hypothetical protein
MSRDADGRAEKLPLDPEAVSEAYMMRLICDLMTQDFLPAMERHFEETGNPYPHEIPLVGIARYLAELSVNSVDRAQCARLIIMRDAPRYSTRCDTRGVPTRRYSNGQWLPLQDAECNSDTEE